MIALWPLWLGYAAVMVFASFFCFDQGDTQVAEDCQRHVTSGIVPSLVLLLIATILASRYKLAFAFVVALIGVSLALVLPR